MGKEQRLSIILQLLEDSKEYQHANNEMFSFLESLEIMRDNSILEKTMNLIVKRESIAVNYLYKICSLIM